MNTATTLGGDSNEDDNEKEESSVEFVEDGWIEEKPTRNKIALAMIVKGADNEAPLLDRALENMKPHIDNVFITLTHKEGEVPNKAVYDICVKHQVCLSYFTWTGDFSAARNYNFGQVPRDYEFILWADSDDIYHGLENLKPLIESQPEIDAWAFWYLYDFDEHNMPTVIHKKTMVVRNDGSVEWTGRIHEDFKEHRALRVKFTGEIERMHATTDERAKESQLRNVEISEVESTLLPNDPRVYFNLANSYLGAGQFTEARAEYEKFIELTGSDDEKYIAVMRLSTIEQGLEERESAIRCLQLAIGMNPTFPDAYHALGYLYFDYKMYDQAELYLLLGLKVVPQEHKMIVFNPRDYDYNPMMALAKVYFQKNRSDLAGPWLRKCLAIYPKSEYLSGLVEEMAKETKRLASVLDTVKVIEGLEGDKDRILAAIAELPTDLQSHPEICRIRNQFIIKRTSSGKDIAYYCGHTTHEWNPEMAKTKGIGGSEEAVINLSKEWVKLGYNVTVFNSCGIEPMTCDGVTYKPYWFYNPKDKYDITVLWRSPAVAEYGINTDKIFVDMHDVIPAGEFTEKRLAKIDKIFVKTHAHRAIFPKVPDEKFVIIPNGQDPLLFKTKVSKVPNLLVNTSSPDRSLDVLPQLFKEVKKRVPEARLKWAYGWEIFDNTFAGDKHKMNWKDKVVKDMEEAGIENCGRLSQSEAAKLYQEGVILAYPSEFYEIDCISVKKAQAVGCVPVTTDFAAFKESNKCGGKVHSNKTIENWSLPYQMGFGISDPETQKAWVDMVVAILTQPIADMKMMQAHGKEWAKQFDWDKITKRWIEQF